MIRNPLAWCAWATAALAAAFLDRNPFLQALLFLVLINVWLPRRRRQPLHLRIGIALGLVPVLFSVALSRFGAHTFLTLPAIPIVGGRWTLEAALFGVSTGAALLLTVGVFSVLQASVRSSDLLSLLPRPLYRAGSALTLSLAFAPKTIASWQSIVEARQLRGQRSGWRSAPGVLVPLLLTTMEQALQYGESLDARGYGNQRRSRYRPISWRLPDLLVVVTAMLGFAFIISGAPAAYDPYRDLIPRMPSLAAVLGVLLLSVPAVTPLGVRADHAPHRA